MRVRLDWRSSEGGHEDQPVALCARQRDQCSGGRQIDPHTLSRLEAHEAFAGSPIVYEYSNSNRSLIVRVLFLTRDSAQYSHVLYEYVAGLARRQHKDADGGVRVAGVGQLRRDAVDAALREPREEHKEQAEDQRGPEGRDAASVPRRGLQTAADPSRPAAAHPRAARQYARTSSIEHRVD